MPRRKRPARVDFTKAVKAELQSIRDKQIVKAKRGH